MACTTVMMGTSGESAYLRGLVQGAHPAQMRRLSVIFITDCPTSV